MSYSAIMVSVEPAAAAESRIRLAQGLADRFDAALIGIAAESPLAMAAFDGGASMQAELIAYEFERVETELAEAGRRFRAVVRPESQNKLEWRSFNGHPSSVLPREARSADLLVIGTGGRIDAGDVLMAAGRPVLLAPIGVATLQSRQVIIGWRDTAQSRRAVTDALPLLRRAEGVVVLAIAESDADLAKEAQAATDAVVAFLARHGVTATAELRPAGQRSVAQELVLAAQERGADLIVVGAYGHARALEWAFGGVTRELLTHCPVCCLMSH